MTLLFNWNAYKGLRRPRYLYIGKQKPKPEVPIFAQIEVVGNRKASWDLRQGLPKVDNFIQVGKIKEKENCLLTGPRPLAHTTENATAL